MTEIQTGQALEIENVIILLYLFHAILREEDETPQTLFGGMRKVRHGVNNEAEPWASWASDT